MPVPVEVPIDYDEYLSAGTKTFVYCGKPTSIFWPLEKQGKAVEGRQAHFARQLDALAEHFGRCIPIHICWASGEVNQMDKGCIGHALGEGLPIPSIGVNKQNEITHIILWPADGRDD